MTVIHNTPRKKSFAKRLAAGVSRVATAIGIGSVPTVHNTSAFVTPHIGKRAAPHRRVIAYRREGPFFRQVGIKWQAGECLPMMQGFFKHRFLHATKGWREYVAGETMFMPQARPAISHAQAFYGSHYGRPR